MDYNLKSILKQVLISEGKEETLKSSVEGNLLGKFFLKEGIRMPKNEISVCQECSRVLCKNDVNKKRKKCDVCREREERQKIAEAKAMAA